jgi:hypothetical protein
MPIIRHSQLFAQLLKFRGSGIFQMTAQKIRDDKNNRTARHHIVQILQRLHNVRALALRLVIQHFTNDSENVADPKLKAAVLKGIASPKALELMLKPRSKAGRAALVKLLKRK